MVKKLIYSDNNPGKEIGLEHYRNDNNFLYIVHYYQMKTTMRNKLLEKAPQKIVKTNNIISIAQLFKKLYYKVIGKYQIIGDTELKYILAELLKHQKYTFFNERSLDYILEFTNQVDSELVDLSQEDIDNPVLAELKDIYQELSQELKQRELVTQWQAYQLLLERMTKEDFKYLYPEVNSIFFDRLYVTRAVELKLILKVAELVEETTILLDYHPDKKKLFANLDSIVEELKQEGFEIEGRRDDDNRLIKELFTDEIRAEEQKFDWLLEMEGEVAVNSFSGPVEELKFTAKKIIELANQGENLSRIAVAFSNPARYITHLDRIFRQYKLPYKQAIPIPLLSSSIIQQVFALLNLLSGEFDKEEFLALASTQLFNSDRRFSLVDSLTEILKEIRFEAQGWELIELIEDKVDEEDDKLIEILKLIKKQFKWNIEQKLSYEAFMDKFSEFLDNLNFAEKLIELEDNRQISAWDSFKSEIAALKNIAEEEQTIKEWIKILQRVIKEGKYKPRGKDGIELTGKIELRSGDYDYIFLLGMSHDLYPGVKSSPLTKYFDELGLELEDKEFSNRYLLADRLLAANKGLFIIYSKTKNEEKPLPSSCITELQRTVKLDPIKVEDKIYSIKDLQQKFAKRLAKGEQCNIKADYDWEENLGLKFCLQKDRGAKGLEAYNGQVQAEENIEWLNNRFDDNYNYSASFLEDYYKCPFQFLFKRIFKAESRELSEEMDHLERGKFVHKIMKNFYEEFSDKRITEENYDNAYQTLMEITKQLMAENPNFEENFYWLNEGERYLKEDRLGTILEQFLDAEMNSTAASRWEKAKGFEIQEIEYKFSDLELISGYLFKGKVDRINYHPDLDVYGVVDYKSGKVTNKSIGKFPIEIPLYILAAKEELNLEIDFGSYYGLKADDKIGYKTVMRNDNLYSGNKPEKTEKFNDLLADAKDIIVELIENLKAGKFNLGEDGYCDYCQAKFLCRKEEL